MYTSYAGAFARVNRNHDIVLVDQRGTGRSAPLTCDYPDDWQAPSDVMPALRQATLACLHKYGERVRFYTSSAAVADLEAVRAALGYRGNRSLRRLLRHARGGALHAALSRSRCMRSSWTA